jgi:hypothetical protein
LEGAFASGQMFGDGGPAGQLAVTAETLINACCGQQDRSKDS